MAREEPTFTELKDGLDEAIQDDDRHYAERLMQAVKQCRMEDRITIVQQKTLRRTFNGHFK